MRSGMCVGSEEQHVVIMRRLVPTARMRPEFDAEGGLSIGEAGAVAAHAFQNR